MNAPSQIKARPILFSGPMVRALMAGSKTQTRRVVKNAEHLPSSPESFKHNGWAFFKDYAGGVYSHPFKCPYGQPGDLLYVKESLYNPIGKDSWWRSRYHYAADETPSPIINTTGKPRKRPSIHMPRRASRLTLEITDVRVERLRNISEKDAIAEGFSCEDEFDDYWFEINPIIGECYQGDAQDDPWLWALTFRVYQQNVDSLIALKVAA
jgi:hypothetical protein